MLFKRSHSADTHSMNHCLKLLAMLVIAASSLAEVVSAADSDKPASPATEGKILADSGFRPSPHGFSFENWGGNEYPYSDLTPNDAAELFGPRACARYSGDSCVPTPGAKLWLTEMNQMMKGGHCEGMAAMSAAFKVNKETAPDYGAAQPFALNPRAQDLMRTISMYFVTQSLEPVSSFTENTRTWSLQKIVDFLVQNLTSSANYPTLGIYGGEGGHAITPYKVEERMPGVYRVYVYDNNYPGAEKFVDIDARNDRWTYAGAALNPKEDPTPWQGGAGYMDITPLSLRYEPLQCPFCGDHKPAPGAKQPRSPGPVRPPAINPSVYSIYTPNRCSQITATRKKDKTQLLTAKTSVQVGTDGAFKRPLRGLRGCFVQLPIGQQYDFGLVDDGRPYTSPSTGLVVFAPGNVYSISNIAVSSTVSQLFVFNGDSFSYQAGGSQRPTIRIAEDRAGSNGYYEISGFSVSDGYEFTAAENSSGDLTFSNNDPSFDSFDINSEVIGETESETYSFHDVDPGEDGRVIMDIESDGDLDVDVDSDSDGQPDDTDADDDNDGALDTADLDDDNDGTADVKEVEDDDYDGISDDKDTDDDNDGVSDDKDTDDDNDGTVDTQEADDDDHDGVADDQDTDDDNDGTADADEGKVSNPAQDSDADDSDGSDHQEDTDQDGSADVQDTNDDNDGTPDSSDADDDNDVHADSEDRHDVSGDGAGEADGAGGDSD
jgi:hypothetical protein